MDHLKILICDDESELRNNLQSLLENSLTGSQIEFTHAANGIEAVSAVRLKSFDIILMDVKMPELDGLEALRMIKDQDPRTFVVIMTAHSNLQDAIQAIKEGAYDYLEKPLKSEKLIELVRKALEAQELVSNVSISSPIMDDDIEKDFVGSSQKMQEVFGLINRLSQVDTTVLIRGENGTGKELVAQAIHYNSTKKNGAFIAINCGAIPESLMESELFGHERGAFTGAVERKIGKFQLANNGTLFLDEIGELKPEMQVKLLRVLQEKKFTPVGSTREVKTTARIIAATNRNLEKMIEDGAFREDLFYRLNVLPIFLPPLRERKDDVLSLVQHFLKKFSKNHTRKLNGITTEALELMKSYRWPGNIRELENTIERAFIIENSDMITPSSLPESLKVSVQAERKEISESSNPLDFELYKESAEKEFIIQALKANKGKINQTVALANIPKNTLLRKIRKYGINPEDYKK